jgi:hypothetical protein
MQHIVIIVLIVSRTMLALDYSIMSHATLFYFILSCIHVDTTNLLNVMCILVATIVILRSIEL